MPSYRISLHSHDADSHPFEFEFEKKKRRMISRGEIVVSAHRSGFEVVIEEV